MLLPIAVLQAAPAADAADTAPTLNIVRAVASPLPCPKGVVRTLDLDRLSRRLAVEDGLQTPARAADATKEYKRFLVLAYKYPDTRVCVTSRAVGKVRRFHCSFPLAPRAHDSCSLFAPHSLSLSLSLSLLGMGSPYAGYA